LPTVRRLQAFPLQKEQGCDAHSTAQKNWLNQRPSAANERTEIGHWERDCVLGTSTLFARIRVTGC
jgi:IS30 family transposase